MLIKLSTHLVDIIFSRWYVEKEIFMVFYEEMGKKELKWELSSDIGKYDNMYKLSFKTINDEGSEQGELEFSKLSSSVKISACLWTKDSKNTRSVRKLV